MVIFCRSFKPLRTAFTSIIVMLKATRPCLDDWQPDFVALAGEFTIDKVLGSFLEWVTTSNQPGDVKTSL